MKAMLKMELTRAFRSKGMLFSLVVGNGIAILFYILVVTKYMKGFYSTLDYDKTTYLLSSYHCILGLTFDTFSYLFTFIVPILAAIPYGASLFMDKKDGYINNILIKTDKKNYFLSKLITLFISGGVVAATPILLSYILAIISMPSTRPYVESGGYMIKGFHMFNEIFYSDYTFLYVIIFIVFDFVLFGLINCLCMVFTYWEDNRFAIVLTPFIICYGMHMLSQYYLGYYLSPIVFAKINFLLTDKMTFIYVEFLVLFLLAITSLRGAKKDVL
ncbi:hypothetical protein [[Clostridium] fimetarium]|uniref:ABC-2 family transporter protein n=1 Tax=[Clostridium] fimetarium TaxID=99656 RepID=A0A1I0MPP1_9FIRM|nr:hypothetical protein [[Clostridium] fimetarium]SEV90504.1 hypothetical protein SAMN05421659_10239 [[Clostridium] fimetarium]